MPCQSKPSCVLRWLPLFVAVVGIVVFIPAYAGGWILDDGPLIAENVHVHSFADVARWFTHDMWSVDADYSHFVERLQYWRPLVLTSYALDWVLSNGTPSQFHITNFGWHGLTCALAYLTLRRWTHSTLGAFVGALLFAVHPSKAESVAWISGRTDILATAAMLTAILGTGLRLRGNRWGLLVELPAILFAFLCKETAIVLTALTLVEGYVAQREHRRTERLLPVLVRASAPSAILSLVYLIGRAVYLPMRSFEVTGLSTFHHVGLVFESLGRYAIITVWPDNLSIDQASLRTTVTGPIVSLPYATLGLGVFVATLYVAWWFRRRQSAYAVSLLLFIALLLPVLNVVWSGFQTLVSPRFLYLPLLALTALFAQLFTDDLRARKNQVLLAVSVLLMLLLGARAMTRSRDFLSAERFWTYELKRNPDSLDALSYSAQRAEQQEDLLRALTLTMRAHDVAGRWYSHTGDSTEFLLDGTDILSRLIPDHNRSDLTSLATFCDTILERSAPRTRLNAAGVVLDVPVSEGKAGARLQAQAPRIRALRAELAARLGDDVTARQKSKQALDSCPRCLQVTQRVARVTAMTGDYTGSLRLMTQLLTRVPTEMLRQERARVEYAQTLDGEALNAPSPIQRALLSARARATLHAWGRAFDQLGPVRKQLETPEERKFLAEVAWKSGEWSIARSTLATVTPRAEWRTLTDHWSAEMRWIRVAHE